MSESVLNLHCVSKIYPGTKALQEATFEVKKGEVHGFLGPNGAGKTTTFNLISGYLKASSGTIELFGKEISTYNKDLYQNLGMLPEIPPLYPHMIVRDYIQFVGDIRGGHRHRVDFVLEKCGLIQVAHRLIKNLSKGYKQRVGMAQALIHNPKFLILDEPTAGLDPIAIMEVRRLIEELKEEHTILLSSHQLHEVEQICSHITIINKGRIISSETLENTKKVSSSSHFLTVEMTRFDDHYLKVLKSEFKDIKISRKQNQASIILEIESPKDLRSEIANFVLTHNLGLLGLHEKKPHLEDVFGKMADTQEVRP